MQNQNYLNYLRHKEQEENKKKQTQDHSSHRVLYLVIVVLADALAYSVYSPLFAPETEPVASEEASSTVEATNGETEQDAEDTSDDGEVKESTASTPVAPTASTPAAPKATIPVSTNKVFNIVAWNYGYSLSRMDVKLGDTVTINLQSTEGYQDIWIEDYRVEIEGVKPGKSGSITFVADEVGVFKFYSKIGNNYQRGMEGLFVVTY